MRSKCSHVKFLPQFKVIKEIKMAIDQQTMISFLFIINKNIFIEAEQHVLNYFIIVTKNKYPSYDNFLIVIKRILIAYS